MTGRRTTPRVPDIRESVTRVEWTLREQGRFPTHDELVALRDVDAEVSA